MRKRLLKLALVLVLAALSLPVLAAAPAAANSYPGLNEQEWFHGNDILNARIAIEVNGSNQGRFRFHLRCFRVDANGRRSAQTCSFPNPFGTLPDAGTAYWFDHTSLFTASRALGIVVNDPDGDYTWVGTYRTLQSGHVYSAKVANFRAYFHSSGYQGAAHTICTSAIYNDGSNWVAVPGGPMC